jgi:hypothetical protein
MAPLAREYKGQAAERRPLSSEDPPDATHAYVGAGAEAWGRFEGPEPDKRFRVLAGSGWRRPVLNPEATTYDLQVKVNKVQGELLAAGVLDETTASFRKDHTFDNWTAATRVISGNSFAIAMREEHAIWAVAHVADASDDVQASRGSDARLSLACLKRARSARWTRRSVFVQSASVSVASARGRCLSGQWSAAERKSSLLVWGVVRG